MGTGRGATGGLTPTALGALANDLRQACMRISRRVRFESGAEIAPHQFAVLTKLSDAPRTPGELAALERVSAPSMTKTVGGLVERGLVERTPDPEDGRQVIVSITADGKRVMREILRQRDEWITVRLKGLSPEEQDTLARATEILRRVADE